MRSINMKWTVIEELRNALGEKKEVISKNPDEIIREMKTPAYSINQIKQERLYKVSKPIETRTGFTEVTIGKGEKEVLIAVAQYGDTGCSREQITILTGYKRSTRDAYIQRLEQKQLVTRDNFSNIVVTSFGLSYLGNDYKPLPTGDALREHWLKELPKGEREVLSYVSTHFPKFVSKDDISEATGFKRSTRDAYIQRLSIRKLIQSTQGTVKASEMLFD